MFGTFFHPRPFGRQRAVAELAVKVHAPEPVEAQVLIALSKTTAKEPNKTLSDDAGQAKPASPLD